MTTLTATDAGDLFRGAPGQFLDVGTGPVAHRRVGRGPDVLFVHGWPVSSATFRLLLPHLVDHVTCHLIDLPGAGDSRVDPSHPPTMAGHIDTVRRVVGELDLDDVAVVGHDSGGMIARHAMAGDDRLRAMALINTEPPDPSWRFSSFVAIRHLPGVGGILARAMGNRRIRRNPFVLGDVFADSARLDGEFDEFFIRPLVEDRAYRAGAVAVLRSFDWRYVHEIPEVHARIDAPVQLVWGDRDPFFPVERARAMVDTFPDAALSVVEGAGLFSHEEAPGAVVEAMLPTLTGRRSSVG